MRELKSSYNAWWNMFCDLGGFQGAAAPFSSHDDDDDDDDDRGMVFRIGKSDCLVYRHIE
eukprot:2542088-Amphidinium_carterae.1